MKERRTLWQLGTRPLGTYTVCTYTVASTELTCAALARVARRIPAWLCLATVHCCPVRRAPRPPAQHVIEILPHVHRRIAPRLKSSCSTRPLCSAFTVHHRTLHSVELSSLPWLD